MVCPLIYNTPEEKKKNAARVYRRTYYERKKEEISIKMAAKYRAKKMVSQVMDSGCQVLSSASGGHTQIPPKLSHLTVKKLSHPVICGVDVAEASLLTCLIFNTLYTQMIRGLGDQQIVLAMLSDRLEILESIQEYVWSSHGGKSRFSAAITERLSNLSHRCKLVTAATKELWCYAAASGSFMPQLISINFCVSKQSLPTKPLPLQYIQEQFLLSRLDEFFAIRNPSQRSYFFRALFSHWFVRWPEEKALFPGIPFHKLTPAQSSAVGVAVKKHREMGYKWTTKDQREFLETFLPEYHEHMVDKTYDPVLKKAWRGFFECWPEHSVILVHVPADQRLTEEQEEHLKEAVSKRQAIKPHSSQQIMSWYRWQNNVSRLSRTSGTKGVLKFDTVLAGGVELSGARAPKKMHIYSHEYYVKKVKIDADKAIHEDNITHCGPQLNKCLAITQEKFEAESDEVKEEVERKYRKAKAKFTRACERLKDGKMPKVDTNTKVKAIRELGPMLDRVFRYLSHATSSWKFSVLMAGPDPTKGGTVVYDYHIGKLGNGAQFNTFCDKFDGIQQAFLEFTNSALAFEATLPQDNDNDDSESDDNTDNEMNNIPTNSVEDTAKAGSSGGVGVGASNFNVHTDDLYRISPDSFNNESQELSALADNACLGLLLHEPQSTLPDALADNARLGFLLHEQQSMLPNQYSNLNFDLDPNILALMAGSDAQIQLPPLSPFTLGFSITADGLDNDTQIQAHHSNPFTPSSSISELPLVLPPPPTPPQTPQVCLPLVPIEPTQDTDLDVPVPSSPANRRRRARAPAAQQQVQLQEDEPRQHRARNVAFNRRELDNAIGSNSSTKQRRGHGDDLGSNKRLKRGTT
ncbi:uncharacterized protein EDB91DRAFT_1083190 [Suillus paluster]|uniref:uncharacterized protein n=1 Tax=Suillus paluster TaxID=48578 RepID=UPI001B85FAFC|nr:uncharacterized protein EDB91DRAFT_1083190 [Suillus paluster]KAG1737156.1 hypothetical protein EDB91DRAFT_1083190 [Suillus paluster]